MKKRILSLLLCVSMASSIVIMLPTATVFAAMRAPVEIAYDGSREIDFNDDWQFCLAESRPSSPTNGAGFRDNGIPDVAGFATADIIKPDYDDSAWRTLNVPHDWSIELAKSSSSPAGAGSAFLDGGLGWYRKTFTLPESMRGKNVSIDFQGVYQNSIVYLNGELIGNYPSGYTGFSFDLTSKLNFGDDVPNVIVVKVQNMLRSGRWYTGSGIIRPVSLVVTDVHRFLRHGVVYTTPNLETTYKADGSAELTVKADYEIGGRNGLLKFRTTVFNGAIIVAQAETSQVDVGSANVEDVEYSVIVDDVRLWSFQDPFRYTITTELLFMDDNLGETVFSTMDKVSEKYGFRYYKIDNSKGFYLNGEYSKLKGVDLHHDSGCLGAADNYDAYKRQMLILKKMGVNAYRTSHNPPSKVMIDVCSELGIVVMEEAFDGWGNAKATYDFGNFFYQVIPNDWPGESVAWKLMPNDPVNHPTTWSSWVITEMVLRDVNEPSVIMWSIGNEMHGMGTKPSWYKWYNFLRPELGDVDNLEFLPHPELVMDGSGNYLENAFDEYTESLRLRNAVLDADGSRYVVVGNDRLRGAGPAIDPGEQNADSRSNLNLLWVLDGYGLNYNNEPSAAYLIDKYHDQAFFFESETASATTARGCYFDPILENTVPNHTPGNRGPSSYDNHYGGSYTIPNEYSLKKDRDHVGFLGSFIWSGWDYLGEAAPYSTWPNGVTSYGCIDSAGFPKDSAYLYASQWLLEPMVHIVPMNWNDWRPGEVVDVWINTNAYQAELFFTPEGGTEESLGIKQFDIKETVDGRKYYETTEPTKDAGGSGYKSINSTAVNTGGYVSPNGDYGKLHLTYKVPFEPGTLRVVAMDEDDVIIAEDIVKTAGQSYTIAMDPDKQVITPDGRSLIYVECDIVDKDGTMVPSAKNLVKFDIQGGHIVGVDNGATESDELYKWGNIEKNTHSERRAQKGKLLVVIQADKGSSEIKLTATSEFLLPTELTITTTAGGLEISHPAIGSAVSAAEIEVSVALGDKTVLPRDVKVTYSSGLEFIKKVTWNAVPSERFDTLGTFTVEGTFEDASITLKAKAIVNVATRIDPEINIALNPTVGAQDWDIAQASGPLATATHTGSASNYPNYMLNGNTSSSWINTNNRTASVVLAATPNASRPYDFVEVYWPTVQTFGSIKLYFTTSGSSSRLPKALNVQYWDGFKWVNATTQDVVFATVNNEATTITFDPVSASRVRVGMENATPYSVTGVMQIVKFEVYSAVDPEYIPPETPAFDIDLSISESVGVGKSVTFTVSATVSDGGTLSYQWYKDDAAIEDATENSFTLENLKTSDSGKYKVIVTNEKGDSYAEAISTICTLTVTSGQAGSGGGSIGEPEVPGTDEPPPAVVFPFTDVADSSWYYDNVYYMWERGLMNGTADDIFSPNGLITRGMVVTVLYRMQGTPDVSDLENPFNDVAGEKYYADAVKWASDKKIVEGFGDGRYGPDENVTREQLAAILYRYQEFTGEIAPETLESREFSDANLIRDYAKIPVSTLVTQGIINGKPNNLFDPRGNATRAEYAAMLNRYLDAIAIE